MAFGEVSPAFPRRFHREVRIQIAIVALGGGHQVNHVVSGFFKLRIGFLTQGPRHGFEPLSDITVLENHAVKLSVLQSSRDTKVGDGVARFCFGNAIVERIPLIGNDHITHQLLILAEKRIVNFELMQVGFHDRHIVLLRIARDADAGRWKCATSLDY
ncbi:hypothetical protein D3C71_955020 [compost metagenome]